MALIYLQEPDDPDDQGVQQQSPQSHRSLIANRESSDEDSHNSDHPGNSTPQFTLILSLTFVHEQRGVEAANAGGMADQPASA